MTRKEYKLAKTAEKNKHKENIKALANEKLAIEKENSILALEKMTELVFAKSHKVRHQDVKAVWVNKYGKAGVDFIRQRKWKPAKERKDDTED